MKTQSEITQFLATNNLSLDNLDSNISFKSNLLISTKNYKALNLYLANTLDFIKNLYQTIDIKTIVNSVLSSLESSKNMLEINTTLNIGTSITKTIGTKIYRIERIDDFKIVIHGDNIANWNVDNLICQLKDINGQIVYPVILTKNNVIEIYFNDMLGSNYKLYWI